MALLVIVLAVFLVGPISVFAGSSRFDYRVNDQHGGRRGLRRR